MDTWLPWLRTAQGYGSLLYCSVYICLGFCIAMIGPVLLDLAAQTHGTLAATGYCIIVRSFGYLAGSMLGYLYDLYPGHRLLAIAMALASLGTLGITAAPSTLLLGATMSLQGVAMGMIDTGANTLLLRLFEGSPKEGGAAMQAMHCAFAVGATLGPLLERLVEGAAPPAAAQGGALAPNVGVGTYNAAFYIVAGLCGALSCALLASASPPLRSGGDAPPAPAPRKRRGGAPLRPGVIPEGKLLRPDAPSPAQLCEAAQWSAVRVTGTLLGVYVGAETGFGSFVTAYAVIAVGSSEAKGQLLAGAYWGAITVGRFAAIWLAALLSPGRFLKLSIGAAAASALFLLCTWGEGALWAGSICFGLSMACVRSLLRVG